MSLNVKNKLKVLFIIVLVILVSCGKKQVKNVIKETEITEFVKQNNIEATQFLDLDEIENVVDISTNNRK